MLCAIPAFMLPEFSLLHLAITRVSFCVMGPWLCVVIYDVMHKNKDNLSKVDNFAIVNECGDQYTQLPSDTVRG